MHITIIHIMLMTKYITDDDVVVVVNLVISNKYIVCVCVAASSKNDEDVECIQGEMIGNMICTFSTVIQFLNRKKNLFSL